MNAEWVAKQFAAEREFCKQQDKHKEKLKQERTSDYLGSNVVITAEQAAEMRSARARKRAASATIESVKKALLD